MPRRQHRVRERWAAPGPDKGQLSVSQGPGLCSKGLLKATSIQKDLPQREPFLAEIQMAFIGVMCHQRALNGNDRKVL